MITNFRIDEQIRSILDGAALDERTARALFRQLLQTVRRGAGSDLAEHIKGGGGDDLADNIKGGGGDDLADNIKGGGGDDLRVGSSSDRGTAVGAIPSATLVDLVKAAAALGRARTAVVELRAVRAKLNGEDRARLEKAINFLETDLGLIDVGYHKYIDATLMAADGRARGRDRAIHVHLHLGS
jgi:hypothetical protein